MALSIIKDLLIPKEILSKFEIDYFKVLNSKQILVFYKSGNAKIIQGRITKEKLYCESLL